MASPRFAAGCSFVGSFSLGLADSVGFDGPFLWTCRHRPPAFIVLRIASSFRSPGFLLLLFFPRCLPLPFVSSNFRRRDVGSWRCLRRFRQRFFRCLCPLLGRRCHRLGSHDHRLGRLGPRLHLSRHRDRRIKLLLRLLSSLL
uniref:Putative secreted protein n=1 Tax=Anopheles marajoara TaxID=58244 RepID=A0A2M4C6I6_9DIPT